MTNDEEHVSNDAASSPTHSVIDALLDGEPVDAHALRGVLANADVREYFVDALVLRQLTQDMEPIRLVAPTPVESLGGIGRPLRWMAAAVLLAVTATGGYIYGQQAQALVVSPMSAEIVVDDTPPPPAPVPTQVIRLEPGVNWTRVNGGD